MLDENEHKPLPDGRPTYPAEKARQGEIVLRRAWQRRAFVGGLAALVILGILIAFLA